MVMELVYDALLLMGIGMGAVFAFLFILVVLVQLMSHWLPKPAAAPATPIAAPTEVAVPANVVAAIAAAIHQFRQKPFSTSTNVVNNKDRSER